jgi:ABC-2 type transport system ATP-binding protein
VTVHPPAIEFQNVGKRFGDNQALRDVSMTIPRGSLFCLLGRNGAGKSTALQILMGLVNPTTGDAFLEGVGLRDPSIHEVRKGVGFLAEDPGLYGHLTTREFLHFIGQLHGQGSEMIDRMEAGLEELGLSRVADNLVRTCSMGMRKRIALLAAILPDPAILILDEPTGSLDTESARTLRRIMTRFQERGRTVVYTTHLIDLAETLSTHLAILRSGRLAFTGSPRELRDLKARGVNEPMEDIFLRMTDPHRPDPDASAIPLPTSGPSGS